jgi:hypothetical protein
VVSTGYRIGADRGPIQQESPAMVKPAFPMPALVVAALAAIAVAFSGGCSSGDGASGGGLNAGADRGALEGPVTSITSELYDMFRLRDAAFLSGGSDTNTFPMVEDTRTNAVPLLNHPKLHYSAIKHTGFLASIVTHTGNLNDPACFGPDLANLVGWSNYFPCVPPLTPRWSINNREALFNLPLATNTVTPVWFGDPPGPPINRLATPTNRYEDNQWGTPDFGNPDPPGYSIHEYYLKEPFIPNASGSRPLTAFQNRYGRLGFIRSAMDLWGYGSVSEAATMSRDVLGPGVGRFLSPPATPTAASPFRGTFIYRVDPNRPPYRSSFWPGAPDLASGNAPITWGWSYDPETGDPVGVAIHAAANVVLCSCLFEIRYTPYSAGGGAFQPTFNGTVPEATSDNNFNRVPVVQADPPAAIVPEPDPALQFNGDPLLHIYPIHYKVYSSNCIPFTTPPPIPNPYTRIDEMIRDSAYQPNEAFIVPVLKPEWGGKMPPGTYRIEIVVKGPPTAGCPDTAPTEDPQHQLRYFHVWNGASPNFFRP